MKNSQGNNPSVSVLIPCLNEEEFIDKCLESIVDQTYSKDNLEVLVVDGMSEDKTREIVKKYSQRYSFVKLLDNPKKFVPFALNKGIKESKGEIIIRCDAHASYSSNYIEKLVFWLQGKKEIGNVGGVLVNEPPNKTAKAKGIAFALSHFFCVGLNKYRKGVQKPCFVDTVPFGVWRREIFEEVGLFNERFLRAQDLEFNMRLKRMGYKILLDPEIKIYYYPRDSFSKLFKMMFQYGYWKNFVNRELKLLSSFRQLVPSLFVLYVVSLVFLSFASLLFLIPLLIYLFLVLFFSLLISIQRKDIRIFPFCVLTFITTHIGYGLGYIKGFWDIWILRKKEFGKEQMEITR